MLKVFTTKIITFNVKIELTTSTSNPEIANTELNSDVSTTNLEVDPQLDSENQTGNFGILQNLYT